MAEEKKLERGVVVRFFQKYGFIKPDEGGDDIFVHYSDINFDGFRTLHKGQTVEFSIQMGDEKAKAVDVTPLDCGDRGGAASVGGGGKHAGDRRGGGGRCFNCRGFGHVASVCPSSRGAGGVLCYQCRKHGHVARDCPKAVAPPVGGGGGSGRQRGGSERSGGGGGVNGGECYNCGEIGHYKRDCRKLQQ